MPTMGEVWGSIDKEAERRVLASVQADFLEIYDLIQWIDIEYPQFSQTFTVHARHIKPPFTLYRPDIRRFQIVC